MLKYMIPAQVFKHKFVYVLESIFRNFFDGKSLSAEYKVFYETIVRKSEPCSGSNPMTLIYNASVVKVYNASVVKVYNVADSLARSESLKIYFEKRSSLLCTTLAL
jgi:hypothetical protein